MSNCVDVCQLIEFDKVEKTILQTSTVAWNQRITKSSLQKWLSNFTGEALGNQEAERLIAAWLLMNFTYYNFSEVQELCRRIYRAYIHKKLEESEYQESKALISDKIKDIIQHTVFINLGNPSESGARILYDFRTTNGLPNESFRVPSNWTTSIIGNNIKNIVLIDDVTISGSQAIDYLKVFTNEDVLMYLLTFFATPNAINNIQKIAPKITPLFLMSLDRRTRLFDSDSFVFSNDMCKPLKEEAYKLCMHYGNKLVQEDIAETSPYMKDYPLGFNDDQQMFAFYYNTPDNTLPIFWCDSECWSPAFKRYSKIYSIEGVSISDEEYW